MDLYAEGGMDLYAEEGMGLKGEGENKEGPLEKARKSVETVGREILGSTTSRIDLPTSIGPTKSDRRGAAFNKRCRGSERRLQNSVD